MPSGWFKLHRKLLESPVWLGSTPEQKVVFITILGLARFRGGHKNVNGKDYKLGPGQFIASMSFIAGQARDGISRHSVRRTLDWLEEMGIIRSETCGWAGSLITILNWERYQEEPAQTSAQAAAQTAAQIKGPAKPEISTKQTELNELFAQHSAQTSAHSIRNRRMVMKKNDKKNDKKNMSKLPSLQNISISEGEVDVVSEVWDYYIETLKKCGVRLNRQLNDSRRGIIQGALRRRHTAGDLKRAIENTWYYDSFWHRGRYFDLVYAIGQRKGIDNVEARQERQGASWDDPGPKKRGRKPGTRITPLPNRRNKFENK